MSELISQIHDPRFDSVVENARNFAANNLGLQVTPVERVAVVHEQNAATVRRSLGMAAIKAGGYNPETDEIVYMATGDTKNPHGALTRMTSQLVHEFTHSGTATTNEHYFYREAIAGVGEAKFLQGLETKGLWQAAADKTLHRSGVHVWVPGAFRYYEQGPDVPGANSTQGLIASIGVGIGMQRAGITSAELMRVSRRGGHAQYDLMRTAVDAIQPGLGQAVEKFPETTDGVMQATAMLEDAARRRAVATRR